MRHGDLAAGIGEVLYDDMLVWFGEGWYVDMVVWLGEVRRGMVW